MSRSSTRRRAVGLLALALPLGLLLPVAGPAQAADVQLSLDGEAYEQRTLEAVPAVAPGGTLVLTAVPGELVDPSIFLDHPGSEVETTLIARGDGSYAADLAGVPAGRWGAFVFDADGETWMFEVEVVGDAPAEVALDLAGPGALSTYYPDAAPQVSGPRGSTVTWTAPTGVSLEGATVDLGTSGYVSVSEADGFAAAVAVDGSSVTVTLPVTAGDGAVPFAGDVDAEVYIELEDAEGDVVALGAPVLMTPQGAERRPTLGVVGTNGAAYTRTDAPGSTYRNLGGLFVGSPTVARTADGRDLFIGQSPNGGLYVRTATTAWGWLAWPNAVCSDPDAEVFGDELVVACRGANGRAYVGRAPITAGKLPFVRTWTNRGGLITGGPGLAIDTTTGRADLVVRGGTHGYGNVWSSSGSEPAGTWRKRALTCTGTPALASVPGAPELQWVACPSWGQQLMVSHSLVEGDAVADEPQLCGGRVVGRPGLTPSWDGFAMRAHVTGTNAAVYTNDVTFGCGPFVRQTGASVSGVGAAGVLPATEAEWGWMATRSATPERPAGLPLVGLGG